MIFENKVSCFVYWDNGYENMSPIIKFIYEHNLKMSKIYNFNLILIDDKNVKNYIDLPPKYFDIAYNFKSGIVRFYILHKSGGIWLDTDVIIIKNLNILYNSLEESDKLCILDCEHGTKIGCCTLVMKKKSICTKFCTDYKDEHEIIINIFQRKILIIISCRRIIIFFFEKNNYSPLFL